MTVLHRFALSAVVVLGMLVIGGCEQGNDAAERNAKVIIPPDMPKTSDEAFKQQQASMPDPTKPPPKPVGAAAPAAPATPAK